MRRHLLLLLAVTVASACANQVGNEVGSHNAQPTNAQSNHSSMDHASMESSPGAASAPIELQFLDTMIVHHGGAIEMAKLAATRAEHSELKKLAADIVRDQEREITLMTELRERWFSGKPKAINMDFPGMAHGMAGMDVKKLSGLTGRSFDTEFVGQMILHHEGALEMAKQVRNTNSYDTLRSLANEIIRAQEAEIRQMKEWQSAWNSK